MVVLGRHCRLWALVVREWGVDVDCGRSPFVGGGLLCPWALVAALFVGAGLLFVGAELSFLGGGLVRVRCNVRGWGAIDHERVVRGRSRFVGGGLLCSWVVAALFVGAGLPFVGAELSSVGGRACSRVAHVRGWVVRGLSFVGAVVLYRVSSPLARSDGTKRTWYSP
jgi:hypothetical protein